MSIKTTRFVLFMAALSVCLSNRAFAQAPLSRTAALVRQSDFVGFIRANPDVSDPTGEWRQHAYVFSAEPIKGNLTRNADTNNPHIWLFAEHRMDNPFPSVQADPMFSSGYPARFSEKRDYLVFLRHGMKNKREIWTTLAAFQVAYQPDLLGHITGAIFNDRKKAQGIGVAQVRALLKRVAAGWGDTADATQPMDDFLTDAALRPGELAPDRSETYEERLNETKPLASAIQPGMTRAEIEKIFPQEDGGASSATTRYYMGLEVMVEIPFDQTGGAFRPQNRVNGAIKVYRSFMNID